MKGKYTNRLRVLRAEHDVTQEDLARRVGMKLTHYWRIEHGYREPTEAERAKLAKTLHTTQAALWPDLQEERAS